ncbi:hypothetical protein NX059_006971 [Plenodomus lindquistii]|nr:hypothetical protein NX059_006971 [Plenodomus lindquistii]
MRLILVGLIRTFRSFHDLSSVMCLHRSWKDDDICSSIELNITNITLSSTCVCASELNRTTQAHVLDPSSPQQATETPGPLPVTALFTAWQTCPR